MKKRMQMVLILLTLNIFFTFERIGAMTQIPGGYNRADIKSEGVVKAARYAIQNKQKESKKKYTLIKILSVQRQVVAGQNYQMCLRVKEKGKEKTAEVVVYQNLDEVFKLTSWEWKECK